MDQKLAPLVSSGVRQAEGMVSSVLKEEASRGALPSQTSSLAGSLQAFTESVVATALSNAGVRSFTGGYLATMIQLRDTIAASLVSAPRPTSADAPRPDSTMADPPADPLDHANLIIVKACEKREKAEPSKGLSLEVLKALRDYDEDSPAYVAARRNLDLRSSFYERESSGGYIKPMPPLETLGAMASLSYSLSRDFRGPNAVFEEVKNADDLEPMQAICVPADASEDFSVRVRKPAPPRQRPMPESNESSDVDEDGYYNDNGNDSDIIDEGALEQSSEDEWGPTFRRSVLPTVPPPAPVVSAPPLPHKTSAKKRPREPKSGQSVPISAGEAKKRRVPVRWGQLEDNKLRQLKETMPNATWMELSTHMMNSGFDKSSKQIRERYTNHLVAGMVKGPYSEAEDRLLMEKQVIFGNKWTQISRFLDGRSEVSVKNRYKTIQNVLEKRGLEITIDNLLMCYHRDKAGKRVTMNVRQLSEQASPSRLPQPPSSQPPMQPPTQPPTQPQPQPPTQPQTQPPTQLQMVLGSWGSGTPEGNTGES